MKSTRMGAWRTTTTQPRALRKKGSGDTLAQFLVIEVSETFDPDETDEEQIDEACRVISTARRELDELLKFLEK